MSRSIAVVVAVLLSAGVGCPTAELLDLPTAPPSSAEERQIQPSDAPPFDAGQGTAPGAAAVGLEVRPSVAAKPYYIAYSADAVAKAQAEGRPVLLYFWAGWCPICKVEEPKLKALIEASTVPVAGFRVNYDIETSLKEQLRVPYQHTTVILDAKGRETERFNGPVNEDELSAAITAAAVQ